MIIIPIISWIFAINIIEIKIEEISIQIINIMEIVNTNICKDREENSIRKINNISSKIFRIMPNQVSALILIRIIKRVISLIYRMIRVN